mgnify:CR=1 FL=1
MAFPSTYQAPLPPTPLSHLPNSIPILQPQHPQPHFSASSIPPTPPTTNMAPPRTGLLKSIESHLSCFMGIRISFSHQLSQVFLMIFSVPPVTHSSPLRQETPLLVAVSFYNGYNLYLGPPCMAMGQNGPVSSTNLNRLGTRRYHPVTAIKVCSSNKGLQWPSRALLIEVLLLLLQGRRIHILQITQVCQELQDLWNGNKEWCVQPPLQKRHLRLPSSQKSKEFAWKALPKFAWVFTKPNF